MCSSLKHIRLGNKVKSIKNLAFANGGTNADEVVFFYGDDENSFKEALYNGVIETVNPNNMDPIEYITGRKSVNCKVYDDFLT